MKRILYFMRPPVFRFRIAQWVDSETDKPAGKTLGVSIDGATGSASEDLICSALDSPPIGEFDIRTDRMAIKYQLNALLKLDWVGFWDRRRIRRAIKDVDQAGREADAEDRIRINDYLMNHPELAVGDVKISNALGIHPRRIRRLIDPDSLSVPINEQTR